MIWEWYELILHTPLKQISAKNTALGQHHVKASSKAINVVSSSLPGQACMWITLLGLHSHLMNLFDLRHNYVFLGVPPIKLVCTNLRTCLVLPLWRITIFSPIAHTYIPSLSVIVTLAVWVPNLTAESLVNSIKPNCSCGSSITRSSSMVKFLQSSMGELVNVRWTVVMAKSIGSANRKRWRVITSMVDVKNIYQGGYRG